MQSPPKPQFASWLIEQVETGQYTGLCYVGQNKFRVPWKHNSRKDCKDEDSKIFRAWAVTSGKINEFPNDKARWKTNFRCALNNLSVRFRMIQDNSKNSDDPHKIYEIINTEYNYEGTPTQVSQEDSVITPDIYSSPTENFPPGNEHNQLVNNFTALGLGNHPTEEQLLVENYCQPNAAVLGGYSVAAENHPQVLPDQPSYYEEQPPPVLNPPLQPSIYDLEISIHYRKKEMLKATFSIQRLQLHYEHVSPDLNAHHLCFPSTEGLLDHKQIEYTNRILNSIQKGLLLEVQETGIYAWRQDRCHVFASTSDPNVADPDPRKLPQNTMVELLSFEKYVNDLRKFKENNGGSPDYIINMCFGEKFPDGKPLEKKLITVQVVPLICRHFHEIAQMEGASSLHSANVSLQISHNSLYDLIYSVFGIPTAEEAARAALPFLPQS
ncbi:interferon regulatory factor 7 [Seriola lalandi dorsalis]|uniref:Interferon regulatory factor 7 n=1 Tax=Seriola lalandi dorsalis TaxID=1841481 RepID=A0A3B4XDZ5_SERLL|nr:interferon regulatory factor 7 [Seriola lalandi dorsalis]XP_056242779.1 interferon regulatory factor 7 [Seriola aureovittata]